MRNRFFTCENLYVGWKQQKIWGYYFLRKKYEMDIDVMVIMNSIKEKFQGKKEEAPSPIRAKVHPRFDNTMENRLLQEELIWCTRF